MKFPTGSHIPQEVDEEGVVQSNAKLLEDYLKKVNWKYLGRVYLWLWGVLLFSVFTLIVIIRLALIIF